MHNHHLLASMKTQTLFLQLITALTIGLPFTGNAKETSIKNTDSSHVNNSVSVETDPAFWFSVLPNGAGIDGNIDFKFARLPHWRFGILGYSGKWSGEFGRKLLLTEDFTETDWKISWNGIGTEAQYRFNAKQTRGGFIAGGRIQWNQFVYRNQRGSEAGRANHSVITPQVGYQWFPFKKLGLYMLPWAGVQFPIAGSDQIIINSLARNTRKPMVVVTAHIGWEFKLRK